MSETYSLEQYVNDLREITGQENEEERIIAAVGPLSARLAGDRSWLNASHFEADEAQGFGAHLLHEEPDHTLAVFAVSWLPGRGTPPHDHGTWAVVSGVEGIERNIRYRRLDNRSRSDYAELEVRDELDVGAGELICIKSGGIHEVINQTGAVTVSLHTYGRHINHTNRSQFDVATGQVTPFIVKVD